MTLLRALAGLLVIWTLVAYSCERLVGPTPLSRVMTWRQESSDFAALRRAVLFRAERCIEEAQFTSEQVWMLCEHARADLMIYSTSIMVERDARARKDGSRCDRSRCGRLEICMEAIGSRASFAEQYTCKDLRR